MPNPIPGYRKPPFPHIGSHTAEFTGPKPISPNPNYGELPQVNAIPMYEHLNDVKGPPKSY